MPKAPPSMISSLQSGVHSVRTFLHEMEDRFHRMSVSEGRGIGPFFVRG